MEETEKRKKLHQNRVKYLKFASIYAGENVYLNGVGGGDDRNAQYIPLIVICIKTVTIENRPLPQTGNNPL